jgi:hypothetical protein
MEPASKTRCGPAQAANPRTDWMVELCRTTWPQLGGRTMVEAWNAGDHDAVERLFHSWMGDEDRRAEIIDLAKVLGLTP